MKRVVLAIVVLGVAAALPAASGAATARGVVVGKERGVLLVASPSGVVRVAAGRAAVGSRVVLAGGRARVVGRAHSARLHGVVVSRTGSTLFLSSNHHLLVLHAGRDAPEKPGEVVATQVSIANGALEENEAETEELGQTHAVQVQALVTAVAPGSVTVVVEGRPLTIHLPGGLTLPASLVGQTVTIQVKFQDEANEDAAEPGDDDAAEPANDDAAVATSASAEADDNSGDRGGDGGGDGGHSGDDGGGHH